MTDESEATRECALLATSFNTSCERMETPPLVYYAWMNLHWNSGAKTATATVELLERQNINTETHEKPFEALGEPQKGQIYYGHGDCIIQAEAFHAMMENGMVTVRFIA
ncbi:uncharacterized protein HD556DRAFT_1311132 [Suillus plorans]|uniref:Uncharacterized protein n=1 Tax=Suillus plorans TaxID=116603 RepID=A0A9P7AJN4_9AGAM|nr:uncharacterized protein HD556DRAFT_1311132 [Suillus plorans]KAG1789734.1 hypothetical protein HD556DRAFT_1311132 [Suillus plorans]